MEDSRERLIQYFHGRTLSCGLALLMSLINIYVLYRCCTVCSREGPLTNAGLLLLSVLCTAMLYSLSDCLRGMLFLLKTGAAVLAALTGLMEVVVVWAFGFGRIPVMAASALIGISVLLLSLAMIYALPMVFLPLFAFLSLACGRQA